MERIGTKISKACEPCRRRKIKCNGEQPCGLCQQHPAQCSYRAKARDRASATRQRASRVNDQATPRVDNQTNATIGVLSNNLEVPLPSRDYQPTDPEVYRGITATHTHGPNACECAQLFYGPSSNFAFLQQLHKGVLHGLKRLPEGGVDDHEGSAGLDMFVQRSIFFGTPSTLGTGHPARPRQPTEIVSAAQATIFLGKFKVASFHLLPMFTEVELDQMLHDLYRPDNPTALRSQEAGLILAALANGALSANATDLAEMLYEQAKVIVAAFDEAVTLAMIQVSILLSDYQVNMGRPNSAYLQLGTATRRAFAMGLNREGSRARHSNEELQKRRSTMWCLYFHERYDIPTHHFKMLEIDRYRWQSLSMGRSSALKFADITCQFPDVHPVLIGLCEIAHIAELNAEEMYLRKSESLQLLYVAAERTYSQLRQFAERAGIAAMDVDERVKQYGEVPALHLHNGKTRNFFTRFEQSTDFSSVYYHAVLLTFRPFLVAMASSHQKQGLMWLRAACRKATDAAQDSLVFISNQQNKSTTCRVRLLHL